MKKTVDKKGYFLRSKHITFTAGSNLVSIFAACGCSQGGHRNYRITIDTKLNFAPHLKRIMNKVRRILWAVSIIMDTAVLIYNQRIRIGLSSMIYTQNFCIVWWGRTITLRNISNSENLQISMLAHYQSYGNNFSSST